MLWKSDKVIISYLKQNAHRQHAVGLSLIQKELYRNWVRDGLEPVVYILLVDSLQLSHA